MKYINNTSVHVCSFLLILLSFFALVCDYLITCSLFGIFIEYFLFRAKKTSKHSFFVYLFISCASLIFYLSASVYFCSQKSPLDAAKTNLARNNLKRIYKAYVDGGDLKSLLLKLQEENEKTILQGSFILLSINHKYLDKKTNKQPLAFYCFYNKYKSHTLFVILLNNGDIKTIVCNRKI